MLITLTGPTGSGKSTLALALTAQGACLLPTWTTRPLRAEEQGRGDIISVSLATMRSSEMLETAEYDGCWYGTPASSPALAALRGEGVAIKILEPQGLALVRAHLAEQPIPPQGGFRVAHVYVAVDGATARRRLMARCGGMPSGADQRRMDRAGEECRNWPRLCEWSHVVDNAADGACMATHAHALLAAVGALPSMTMRPEPCAPSYPLPGL